MLTEKHKEVEAFLNKHKHRRYMATQIYEKVEGLRYPTEATEICNKLVELGLIREGFNGLRMTYQAWPSAMAVPNDAPKVKPMPQIKTRTGETLPAIETREEKPMELNDEHAAVEDRTQAVGLNNPEPATSSPATGESSSEPGRDWEAESQRLENENAALRQSNSRNLMDLESAGDMNRELQEANQRLAAENKALQEANEQLVSDFREKSVTNQLLHGEMEGLRATVAAKDDQIHGLLNERENDIKLINSLHQELELARADRGDLSLDLMPGPLQLSRPFRAGVMFDENGNKVLLVDGSAVIVEYTAKQVGVILKAVDNLEWSGA